LTEIHDLISKAVKSLDLATEAYWYHKLGDLALDFTDFCIRVNKPVKGIHVLQQAILAIQ
jgi:hypothetical protein